MCGIAGAVGVDVAPDVTSSVVAITRALAHRGPDGEAFWVDSDPSAARAAGEIRGVAARVALGHRRLSIVDVDGGLQPMTNEDGRVWVTFNGEIYNHVELRRELERAGHRFRTRCDTEVLVHGWEEWGTDLFGRLNGIFAFAIADRQAGEVVLVRDPAGVKPLYFGTTDRLTWWSSELGAVPSELTGSKLSADALKLFLTFRFIPSPNAIYEGVAKLPPGHYARVLLSTAARPPAVARYRVSVRSSAAPTSQSDWGEALAAALESAVERQLMADVPVASLLSGGVDSSFVTQLMARHLPYRPTTFGIGFASDGDESETHTARRAADALGVPHQSVLVPDDAAYIAEWPGAIAAVSEPVGNTGGLLVGLLCEQVRHGHKVVLTGQGADEPLGGYPRHMVERVSRLLGPAAPFVASPARHVVGPESAARLERILSAKTLLDRFVQTLAVIPPARVDRLVRGSDATALELARAAVARWAPDDRPSDSLNALLVVDARLSLSDDLLLIADAFSMRASVELRVPFLDLEFLELVERMPSRYKISWAGQRKWLYRRVVRRRLPAAIARAEGGRLAHLTRKRGFSTPTAAWFDLGGSLADATDWATPLRDMPALTSAVASASDRSGGGKERIALYTLASWARGRSSGDVTPSPQVAAT